MYHSIGLRFFLPAALSLLVVTASAHLVAAQSTSQRPKPAIGASFDRFVYEGAGGHGVTAVTFRYSALWPRTLSTELGVSLFPDALLGGALLLAPDLGAGYNATGPNLNFLAKGGLSALTGLGAEFAFYPGVHVGGGLLLRIDEVTGIRVDLIRHVYLIDHDTDGIWSIGLGFTSLPRRVKQRP